MRRRRTIPPRSWADIGALGALAIVGLLGFATSFDDPVYLIAGVGGLLVGTGAGVVAGWWRSGPLVTILLAGFAYFLFGTAFAMPAQGIALVVPSPASLGGLARGAVFGWTDIVTLSAPVAAPDYIGVLPYVAGAVVGLVSATIATRWNADHRRGWIASGLALLAPLALYLTSVLTGTDIPYLAPVRGVVFALIAVVWVAWRPAGDNVATGPGAGMLRRRLLGIGVIVLVAVVGGSLSGAASAPSRDQRFVLRERIEPPFDPLQYASPLSGFRKYTKSTSTATLFTVDGLRAGDRIRIATMDSYDGRVWNVTGPDRTSSGSGTFGLVGARLPQPPLFEGSGPARLTVTVGAYRDVWMPLTGYPRDVEYLRSAPPSTDLRYNAQTGVLLDTGQLRSGQRYTVDVERQRIPKDSALEDVPIATVALPPVTDVPDLVGSKAKDFAGGAKTPIDQLRALEKAFTTQGELSHGTAADRVPSRAGHGADRMKLLLSQSPMVGDQEQFASAFALMARSLGYPARVVMGFAPSKIPASGAVAVKSKDVTAWVEVPFRGVGWIPFSPTPDPANVPQTQTSKPKAVPLPQVRQPPRTHQNQDDLVQPTEVGKDKRPPTTPTIPGWVWSIVSAVGVPLLVVLAPPLVIAGLKMRRRRRRRERGTADRRAAGAWDELVDLYSELGYAVPDSATRLETAESFEGQLRGGAAAAGPDRADAAPALRAFAMATDTAVFGGAAVEQSDVEALWSRFMEAGTVARDSVGRTRRVLSAVRFRIGGRLDRFVRRLRAVRGAAR